MSKIKIETAPIPDIYGNTIFCDDIRLELEGKITYVGTYTGTLLVKLDFPVTLPKFCIAAMFAQKAGLFERNLKLLVFLPGDSDEKASIEADVQVPPDVGTSPSNNEDPSYAIVGSNLMFAPLMIEKPGQIKVRVLRNGVLHRIGALNVKPFSEGPKPASAS
jgi:hypothetical protein